MNEKPQKLETSLFNDVLQILQAATQRAYTAVNSDPSFCYTLCSKLTWSHNRLIMRVQNENARYYYLNESTEQNWSVRSLERNINTFYNERLLSSQNKQEAFTHSNSFTVVCDSKANPKNFT